MDDIADHPCLDPAAKTARLDGYAAALRGDASAIPAAPEAHAVRRSLAATGVTGRHCRNLIDAFRQDAVQSRYDTWDELMEYCDRSAAPVGRYLVDLHGEAPAAYAAADALCHALQVLNHLQDCADDYRILNRIYLPRDWMTAEAVDESALAARRSTRALRAVLDRCLDATDRLLVRAGRLPAQLRGTRSAVQASVIVCIAERLSAALRRRDPLAERVVLTPPQYLGCGLKGALRVMAGKSPRRRAAVLRSRPTGPSS